jgi:hypothetical protein
MQPQLTRVEGASIVMKSYKVLLHLMSGFGVKSLSVATVCFDYFLDRGFRITSV